MKEISLGGVFGPIDNRSFEELHDGFTEAELREVRAKHEACVDEKLNIHGSCAILAQMKRARKK